MALNQNHIVEELGGMRCAIVEKNCSPARVEFLTRLLAGNGYTVVSAPSPPAKPKASPKEGEAVPEPVNAPETFTVGVTDVMFNPVNALYGRLLRNSEGKIVTPDYWNQKEHTILEDTPYYISAIK